jgi:tetratricopeptide (TPR) repeat protein
LSDAQDASTLVNEAIGAKGRDWFRAVSVTKELRERFPDNPAGYQVGSVAARALRRFDEASTIIAEAAARFPTDAWPLVEAAWLASVRGDVDEAARLATELRERFPDNLAGYQIGSVSARARRRFDVASEIVSEAMARFPTEVSPLVEAAWIASARGDTDDALRLATALRERFPDNPAGYQVGSAAARALRRFDEASTIVTEALARFPTEASPLVEAAWLASARGEADNALRLGTELRERFPDNPAGYQIGSVAARALRRFDEASMIIAEAAARFPTYVWPLVEAAWLASLRADAETAARLAEALRASFPDNPAGYQVGSAAARALHRFDEASTIVAEALARFPTEISPLVESAWLAVARGNLDEAIRMAAELRVRFPANSVGYQIGVAFLRQRSHMEEAEALLRKATICFPSESWPAKELATAIRRRANRAKAVKLIGKLPNAISNSLGPMPPLAEHRIPTAGKKRVVVILGMHRAGTSLCAKIAQRLGIELGGPMMGPGFDNPDGYREHATIVECHQLLLDSMGTYWDTFRLVDPPAEAFWQSEKFAVVTARLKSLVIEQIEAAGGNTWGFKDPRTLRFLPLWKKIFEELGLQPIWILCIRDPSAVAASLLARDGIAPVLGELLWLEHYLDALRDLGPDIAAIIHYERWFSATSAQAEELSAAIGGATGSSIEDACRSIKTDLRHHVSDPSDDTLDLARRLHTWIAADALDLNSLQWRAANLWRSAEETGRTLQ